MLNQVSARRRRIDRGCGKRLWSGGPGRLSPGLPQNPYVTVSRYTALVVLVIWRPVSPRPSARSTAAGWRPLRPWTGGLSSSSVATCACSGSTPTGRCGGVKDGIQRRVVERPVIGRVPPVLSGCKTGIACVPAERAGQSGVSSSPTMVRVLRMLQVRGGQGSEQRRQRAPHLAEVLQKLSVKRFTATSCSGLRTPGEPRTFGLIHRAMSADVIPVHRCSRQDRTSALIFFRASLLIAGRNEVNCTPSLRRACRGRNVN